MFAVGNGVTLQQIAERVRSESRAAAVTHEERDHLAPGCASGFAATGAGDVSVALRTAARRTPRQRALAHGTIAQSSTV